MADGDQGQGRFMTMSDKTPQFVKLERAGRIATVTIDRPEKLNAIDNRVLDELEHVFDELERDGDIRVVIVTGAGEKAFVAGGDIEHMRNLSLQEGERFVYRGHALLSRIENSRMVVIAAVNGYALGGGTELALACDFRVASENAQFGLPEVTIGLFPGWGGTQRLARLVGVGLAKELVFTGERISAQRALEIGLVNRVVKKEELMDVCRQIAEKIIANSPIAVYQAKKALNRGTWMTLEDGLKFEAESWLVNFATQDRVEGLSAFLEKRKPIFTGK